MYSFISVYTDLYAVSTLQVQYYGLIKQQTGEDWENAKISLSTAQPSVGGSAPSLPTRIIRFKRPKPVYSRYKIIRLVDEYDPAVVSSAIIVCLTIQLRLESNNSINWIKSNLIIRVFNSHGVLKACDNNHNCVAIDGALEADYHFEYMYTTGVCAAEGSLINTIN